MFQTSINHFFQDLGGGFSDRFMNFISNIGVYQVYLGLILIIMFGWDLRKGLFLMHIMIWIGMMNNFVKDLFSLPRPIDIDETLRVPGPDYNHINIDGTNHSSQGFFHLLPQTLIDKCRAAGLNSPGFPSGHSASATAFWISLPLLVKKTWIWIIGLLLMCLIMISRLYLGVHFLADILGGIISGLVIVILAFLVYYRLLENDSKGLKRFPLYTFSGRMLRYFYYLCVPVALSFVPSIGIHYTAALFGVNLVIITSNLRDIQERGQIWERAVRVILAFFVYLVLAKLIILLPQPQTQLLKFIEISIQLYLAIRLSISLSIWAKLYRRIS